MQVRKRAAVKQSQEMSEEIKKAVDVLYDMEGYDEYSNGVVPEAIRHPGM